MSLGDLQELRRGAGRPAGPSEAEAGVPGPRRRAAAPLDSRELHVSRALQRVGGELRTVEPKTAASRRVVVLPRLTVRYLREHRTRQNAERLKLGDAWRDHGLVFPSSIGTPIEPRNVNRRWDDLRVKAGLEGLRR